MTIQVKAIQLNPIKKATKLIMGLSGKPGLVWLTGVWAIDLDLLVDNALLHNGSSYRVSVAHTSTAATEPGIGADWATVWAVVAKSGTAGSLPATVTQAEAEAGTSTDTKLWSSLRVWQAIVAWGAKITSVFSGILSGYKEASGTITIIAGAAAYDHAAGKNVEFASVIEATTYTFSNITATKPLVINVTHDASGPWVQTFTDGVRSVSRVPYAEASQEEPYAFKFKSPTAWSLLVNGVWEPAV